MPVKQMPIIKKKVAKRTAFLRKVFKKKKNKKYLFFLAVVSVISCLLYLGKSLILVAFVNGTPITRLEYIVEMEKIAGPETLDSLITRKLIDQEARESQITISQDEIQTEIDKLAAAIESQGGTLEQALVMQGQTQEGLRDNIRIQKTVEKILADKIAVNEEDVLGYFEENKNFYEEGTSLNDVRLDIENQLFQQKLSTEFGIWMEELKASSDINYLINP
jgi:foldase protein PrsA